MEHKAAFGMKNNAFDLTPSKTKMGARRTHVRIDQAYAGIPVFAAQTIVQLNEANGVEYVSSDAMTDDDAPEVDGILSVPAAITAAEAELIASGTLAESNHGLEFHAEPATLMIYQPAIVGNAGPAHLVWHTTVASVPVSRIAEVVLVDAHSADVALRYSLVQNALNRQIYDSAYGKTTLFSLLRRKEGDMPYRVVPDVDLAYDYVGDVYNFFLVRHGRDGIDGAGLMPRVYVRWCADFDAFWSRAEFIALGEDCVADDCVAHEYAHGVTQNESGLIYLNESGAISESLSDMWGEWVDQTNGRGDDASGVKWLIGEDLFPPWFAPDFRPALRNMKNPSERPYLEADRKGSPYWISLPQGVNPTEEDDWGGIHANCGVGNKLCYLLIDGDVFNGYSVYGMGIDKVADLFYEVQTNLLTSAADYDDLYFALTQAAENLQWTEAEKQNLQSVCRAVEIYVAPSDKTIYNSVDVPKGIPDGATTFSTLSIDNTGTIADVNVKLDITHTWDADLRAYLISPDGTRVELFTYVGGWGEDFSGTVFDDEASLPIRAGSSPFASSFRPAGRLSTFAGKPAKGIWRLEISDDSAYCVGRIICWSLTIKFQNK